MRCAGFTVAANPNAPEPLVSGAFFHAWQRLVSTFSLLWKIVGGGRKSLSCKLIPHPKFAIRLSPGSGLD